MSNRRMDTSLLPWLLATVAAGGAAIIYALNARPSKGGKDGGPPTAPKSMLETIRLLSGKEAPFFIMDMAKECNSMFIKLNLPLPGGMYVIGDHKAQREILSESDKPVEVYGHFHKIGGKPNIFTRSTTDPIWKAARKGSAPAFSSKEVNRMNQVCAKHLEDWIENTLKPCVENGTTFDPSVEMTKLTFSIM